MKPKAKKTEGQGGKQQTLFGLKGQGQSRPALAAQESMAMTETDPDLDRDGDELMDESEELQEAQGQGQGILEESMVCLFSASVVESFTDVQDQERVGSPEWDETQEEVEI
jgi:hypothetical protein